jgi:anaerobic selenocysteine-containing dehydrogenase
MTLVRGIVSGSDLSRRDFLQIVGLGGTAMCTQCASACGIMGRVREGRVLKLEGNPEAATSGGKICGLGQAAVQQRWSPDRLTTPMIRENGVLMPATWDKAMVLLSATLAPGDRTGPRGLVDGTDQRPSADSGAQPHRGRRCHRLPRFRGALHRGRGIGQSQAVWCG